MRRLVICTALALVACSNSGPSTSRDAGPPDPAWIENHVAEGWFQQPGDFGDEGLARTIAEDSAADGSFHATEVNLDPTGEAFDDEERAEPRSAAPPVPFLLPAGAEETEESPRFGPATEGVTAFGGAHGEEEESDAAPRPWQRSRQPVGACRLSVGDDDHLPLDSYQAVVRIDGFRARVALDLLFSNPHDSALEGRFKLRLPDGAAVHHLAFGGTTADTPLVLPVNTSSSIDLDLRDLRAQRTQAADYREGRMVPREQAQRAYAAETAQAIDPALLEWSGSGVFDATVFPLQPNARSRITLAYDLDLTEVDDALEFMLGVPDNAGTSHVTIQVSGSADSRTIQPVDGGTRDDAPKHSSFTWSDAAGRHVGVRVQNTSPIFLTGRDEATGPLFAARVTPDLPRVNWGSKSRAVFVVDTSLSETPERMVVWSRLLRAILERNRAHLTEFRVLFFNVETWWGQPRFVGNDTANVDAVLSALDEMALEGATDLGAALREAGAAAGDDADIFLFSDGAETWGAREARNAAADLRAPLYCYTTRFAGSDSRSLAAMARASNGAVFSVTTGTESELTAAAEAHLMRPILIREARIEGCTDLVIEGNPTAIYPGQTLRIAGRGKPGAGAELTLRLEDGDTKGTRRVALGTPVRSELTARTYGSIATALLEDVASVAGDDARAYGLHFGVTGSTCSLLMLEDEAAYARYEIVPGDDAARVRERLVSAVLAESSSAGARVRSDAREAFLAWIDRIEDLSGVTFSDLDDVRAAARLLPAAAFDVDAPPLVCNTRSAADLGPDYRDVLSVEKMTYDAAHEEALARLSARGPDDAIRALSSLVEADPGSSALLRDVAFTILDWERPAHAVGLLRRVTRARPHEPETYRALAESLAGSGNIEVAMLVYEVALRGEWDPRFGAFRLIAAMDYLRLLRRIERGELSTELADLADDARERIASQFVKELPDIAITLAWNTDRTDIDLHVVDPSNFVTYYGQPRSPLGGGITQDVTTGYGPEMFVLGDATPGEYVVHTNYFASDALRTTLRSRCYVTIARWVGTPEEKIERRAVLMSEEKRAENDMIEIGRFTWE